VVFQNNLLMGAGGQPTGYDIDQSCRFDGSAYLYRQWPSDGNRRTFTISAWVKRGALGSGGIASGDGDWGQFTFDNSLSFYDYGTDNATSGYNWNLNTSAVYRDIAAWYHVVGICDTTQSTEGDRIRLYVNGERITSFSTETYPSEDFQCNCWGRTRGRADPSPFYAGGYNPNGKGYVAEFVYLDGVVAEPSSFGETDETTGQWIPIDVSELTFGDEGCLLAFQDSSALGDDTSGEGNDFTSSGLAAGDQMGDTPTENRPTFNSLWEAPATISGSGLSDNTYANGNLEGTYVDVNNADQLILTMPIFTGMKVACEFTLSSGGGPWDDAGTGIGIWNPEVVISGNTWFQANTGCYKGNGTKQVAGSSSSYGISWSDGDIITIEVDNDAGAVGYRVNGADQGEAFTFTPETIVVGQESSASGGSRGLTFNNGAPTQTVTSGFNELKASTYPAPTIVNPGDYFNTDLYTGTGESLARTGIGFQPNLLWDKSRSNVDSHDVVDSVRGVTKYIYPESSEGEGTETDKVQSFDSDGYTLGDGGGINGVDKTYVAWLWKESATSGFDIVTYTGNETNRTISHSLSAVPELMIVKNRSAVDNWIVYHASNTSSPEDVGLILNTTSATVDAVTYWNDTAPTSSVFTVGTGGGTNGNTNSLVAYLFAGVEGFSKFSSYVGNGDADGPFVWCGFRPAFILEKNASSLDDWVMWDNQRNPYNVSGTVLKPNVTDAETTASSKYIDFLSNGFKLRASDTGVNGDGNTHIFWACAKTPFKTALAR